MTTPYRVFIALPALLLAACQSVFYAGVNLLTKDAGIVEQRGLVYAPDHGLALDVYRPQRPAVNAPIIVFFYGGSWRSGQRGWHAFVGRTLAKHGVIVVIPDYRKAPAVTFPAFVEDGARAIAWTRAQAIDLGGDPARLHVMGHSAGAHIAAVLATDGRYLQAVGLQPSMLVSAIGLAGPYDFLPITSRKVAQVFGPREQHPHSQPINFVDGDEPPFLLLHGRDDNVVEPANSERLSARLHRHGIDAVLTTYPDLGHAGILLALARPARSRAPVLTDILRHLALPTDAHTRPIRVSPAAVRATAANESRKP